MTKQSLGGNILYDPDVKGYVMLDLTDSIPTQTQQTIDGEALLPKHEFHTSLIALEYYIDSKDNERQLATHIADYAIKHPLRFTALGSDRYLCKKNEETTLIAPMTIDGLDELKAYISTLVPDYQPPFPHVTLLKSRSSEFGISIKSLDDLDQYCRLVSA